jgi:septation ring formation regulator EzrA
MIEHVTIESFIPLVFLIFPMPFMKKWFGHVDPSKFAYAAATSGIILTFYGIWLGLAGFDVTNIEASIPALLSGLKTAFSSSLAGLSASMVINLFFVESKEPEERSLEESVTELRALNKNLSSFTKDSAEAQLTGLTDAINDIVKSLELGITSETHEVMIKFRTSVDTMRIWQEQYMEEIKSVIDAMDKNGIVTAETTKQLLAINHTLGELKPVTETIADSIGYVQHALPSFRRRGVPSPEDMKKNKSGEDS